MTASVLNLPVPEFYDSRHAAEWAYCPNHEALLREASAWVERYGIAPAISDRARIVLLVVDAQKDFCFPEGALYVGGRSGRGAIEDNDRLARFIYRSLGVLSEITCTLDTHFPFQIFFPGFWIDDLDRPLLPNREITVDDIRQGAVRPAPALAPWLSNGDYTWLQRQVTFYCEELERAGKYKLYLWPLHCLLGSDGHALAGVIHEARLFHALARRSRANVEVKGSNPLTENYSILAPEVLLRHDGKPLARRNTQFIKTLLEADAVVIAGQAASHCVKSTVADLLTAIRPTNEELVRKIYLLEDCMSAVTVPDPARRGAFLADFTPQAEAALREFADAGMHVVRSTNPIEAWPDIPL